MTYSYLISLNAILLRDPESLKTTSPPPSLLPSILPIQDNANLTDF